jgi:hypothetical protein
MLTQPGGARPGSLRAHLVQERLFGRLSILGHLIDGHQTTPFHCFTHHRHRPPPPTADGTLERVAITAVDGNATFTCEWDPLDTAITPIETPPLGIADAETAMIRKTMDGLGSAPVPLTFAAPAL